MDQDPKRTMVRVRQAIAIVASFFGLCIALGCSSETLGIASRVRATCQDEVSDLTYFGGVFSVEDDRREARVNGVSRLLFDLGEKSISCGDADEVYRILYMPERGNAVAIRAARVGDDYTIMVAGDAANRLAWPMPRRLTAANWDLLTRAIAEYSFWNRLPYPSPTAINHSRIVVHGPAWLLEGRDNGWYHVVSRVSVSKEPAFDRPARTFFELAQLEVPAAIRPRP